MRVEALTFWRFFAAVIVIFFHYGQETDLAAWGRPFLVAGPPMLSFFFVLSGYVMVVAHFNKQNETLRSYYVSRIARVYPVYLFALLFMASLSFGYGINDLWSLLLSALLVQSWVSPYPVAMNSPGWSLSVEAFFYLSFPLAIYLVKRFQLGTARLFLIAAAVYLLTQFIHQPLFHSEHYKPWPSLSHDLIFYLPLSHYCSFLLGIAGGVFYVRNKSLFALSGFASTCAVVAPLALAYYLLDNPQFLPSLFGFPLFYGASFYAWLFLLVVLGLACGDNPVTRLLSTRPLVYLGGTSYSVYILQKPVHVLYQHYIAEHLNLGVNGDFYAYAALLMLVSCFVYSVIEKFGRHFVFWIDRTLRTRIEPLLVKSRAK